jgi:hypothetical protein
MLHCLDCKIFHHSKDSMIELIRIGCTLLHAIISARENVTDCILIHFLSQAAGQTIDLP